MIMYADTVTDSMFRAISETNRRRAIQMAYNEEHHIVPQSVRKAVRELMEVTRPADADSASAVEMSDEERQLAIDNIENQMLEAAARLDFEKAAKLRDQLMELRGEIAPAQPTEPKKRARRKRR